MIDCRTHLGCLCSKVTSDLSLIFAFQHDKKKQGKHKSSFGGKSVYKYFGIFK